MEADWEFEIASDAPVIDAAWTGFVDLKLQPERVTEISELSQLGIRSRAYTPGPYSKREELLHAFDRTILGHD